MFAGIGNRQFDYRQRFRYSRVARGRRKFGRKNRNLPRKIRMDKLLRKSFPKLRIRLPSPPATAKYSRSPYSVSPLRSQMKRRSAVATPTSWPTKASSIAIFATNDKTRRRKRRSPPAPSSADAGGKVSIVRHRRNKKDWILRMKSEDAPRFTRPISNLMNRKATGDEN